MAKRPRVEEQAASVLKDLEAVYGDMPEELLWDTATFQTLVQPTAFHTWESGREYRYIGRSKAKGLLQAMAAHKAPQHLHVEGAKGSGKSTVVSSIVGYMLAKKKRRVVYICAARFVNTPFKVLKHALLVAMGGDSVVAGLSGIKELGFWLSEEAPADLLFVVDDWDKFETFPNEAKVMDALTDDYALVKLSSANSRERRVFAASDKSRLPFDFDGPYTQDELQTWIGQSSLSDAKLQALETLTGGMPGLLWVYEDVNGNSRAFMHRIEESYTKKLFEKLVSLQTTKLQLASAVEMVTTGVLGYHLKTPVDLTCFYREGNKFKLLCPYLRSRAELFITEQHKHLLSGLEYAHVQTWVHAVRMDCQRGRNPARDGWNAEGVIIGVMRYQGRLWDGREFNHYRTYEHGLEAELLESLTLEELSEGVLVGPIAFNERALDVVYLKLDHATSVLTIVAVQIIIAKWKSKRRKKSHRVWQEQVLPMWLGEKWSVEHQFVYLTPSKVTKEDLVEVNKDLLSYVAACHAPPTEAAPPTEDDEEDDGGGFMETQHGTEYEKVDLATVKSLDTMFKNLSDVHDCLKELDAKQQLEEPARVVKPPVRGCAGRENGACRRWARTSEVYYCSAHKPQAVVE